MSPTLSISFLLILASAEIFFFRRRLIAQVNAGALDAGIAQKRVRYYVGSWVGLILIFATYAVARLLGLLPIA
jgi:hypothetical protein